MARESFSSDRDRRAAQPRLRLHQGRSRGAAGGRPDLYARAPCARRAGRLAAHYVPDAERQIRSGAAPIFRPSHATDGPVFRRFLSAVPRAWKAGDPAVMQNADGAPGASQPAGRATSGIAAGPGAARRGGQKSLVHLGLAARQLPRRAEIPERVRPANFSGGPGFGPATKSFRTAVLTTLNFLCQGGIYDHLGGGFSRYSVDQHWLVPHFEKMLYDNAQLLSLLACGFRATRSRLLLIGCRRS